LHCTGAAAVGRSSVHASAEQIGSDLIIYEKVLHVLSAETSRLQNLMNSSEDNQQQHKTKLDSLSSKVSGFKPAEITRAVVRALPYPRLGGGGLVYAPGPHARYEKKFSSYLKNICII